ncbi:hypothetical protein HanRHA438_Chr01g0028991 [Helianthus annuus]|nr:hypothetical protein HanRHA438_Chr01g0028991 [Helianthus annuus]
MILSQKICWTRGNKFIKMEDESSGGIKCVKMPKFWPQTVPYRPQAIALRSVRHLNYLWVHRVPYGP